jgi:Uma2 family endonuclease
MTVSVKTAALISPEEYLHEELASSIRREYVNGWIFPRLDSDADHCRITGNLLCALAVALRGSDYEPFSSAVKLKVELPRGAAFYYPDVMVVRWSDERAWYRDDAAAVFEVVSEETQRTDRIEKKWTYRNLRSIEYYVLVEQDRLAVTVMHAMTTGWKEEVLEGRKGILELPSLSIEIPFERIYERTSVLTGSR